MQYTIQLELITEFSDRENTFYFKTRCERSNRRTSFADDTNTMSVRRHTTHDFGHKTKLAMWSSVQASTECRTRCLQGAETLHCHWYTRVHPRNCLVNNEDIFVKVRGHFLPLSLGTLVNGWWRVVMNTESIIAYLLVPVNILHSDDTPNTQWCHFLLRIIIKPLVSQYHFRLQQKACTKLFIKDLTSIPLIKIKV